MGILWLIQAAAAFVFGIAVNRFLWPRMRYRFWTAYYWVVFRVRYILPMDCFLLWPRLYRAVREVF